MRKERILPVDAIAQGQPGRILGLEGARAGSLQLTPWYSTSPWREAVMDGQARVNELTVATNPLSRGRDIASGPERSKRR